MQTSITKGLQGRLVLRTTNVAVADPDNPSLSVEYRIRRGKPADVFQVEEVSTKAMVGELKTAIKAGSSGDLENNIQLYKILVHEEPELCDYLGVPGSGRLLKWNEESPVFDDVPFSRRPGVVVEPGAPSLTGPAAGIKHERLEDPLEANKRIRLHLVTLPMQTPSVIAMPCIFREHYEKHHEPHIRCGRPGENQSPFPLVLAHPIFATFVSECETYKQTDEDLTFILKLSQCMCRFFKDERERGSQFRACLREYGINLTEAKIEGTDYMTTHTCYSDNTPRIISDNI